MAPTQLSWKCCALLVATFLATACATDFTLRSSSPCGIGTHRFAANGTREYTLSLTNLELPAGCQESDIYVSSDLLTHERCQTKTDTSPGDIATTIANCKLHYDDTLDSCDEDWTFVTADRQLYRRGNANIKPLKGAGDGNLFQNKACAGAAVRPRNAFYFVRSSCDGVVRISTEVEDSASVPSSDSCSGSFADSADEVIGFDTLSGAEKGAMVAVWVIALVATLAPLLIAGVVLIVCCCCASCPIAASRRRRTQQQQAAVAAYPNAMPAEEFKVAQPPADYNPQPWGAVQQPYSAGYPPNQQSPYAAQPAPYPGQQYGQQYQQFQVQQYP